MMTEVFAFSAAFFFAASSVVARVAADKGGVISGLLVSLATTTVSLGVLVVAMKPAPSVAATPLLLFAAAGFVGTGLGQVLIIRSVRDFGASVAVPLQSSASPALAAWVGWTVLGESATPEHILAFLLILAGIWLCWVGGTANRGRRPVSAIAVLLPLGAGAAFGMADVLRKVALSNEGEALTGALVGSAAALAGWLVIGRLWSLPARGGVLATSSRWWFVLHGVMTGTAQIAVLLALRSGDISVVSPIVASQSVIVVVMSALLLRQFERVTFRVVAGALLVLVGVVLISVS